MESVKELVKTLKNIEKDSSIKCYEGVLPNDIVLIENAICLADYVLINEKGSVNYEAMEEVEDAGFQVIPLEMDAFGWLVAGIQTSKGLIVFG
jgi:hypothetical protein